MPFVFEYFCREKTEDKTEKSDLVRASPKIIYLPFRGVTTIGSRSPFSRMDWASSSKAFGSNSFPFLDQDLQPQLPNRMSSSTSKSAGHIQSL
jgi:hypothetical protein